MTRTSSELDRLGALRHALRPDTDALVDHAERERLLDDITSGRFAPMSEPTHDRSRALRPALTVAVAVGTCAAVAGGVVGATVMMDRPAATHGATRHRPGGSGAAPSTVQVIRATTMALDSTSNDLLETTSTGADGQVRDTWFDFANGDSRADFSTNGQPQFSVVFTGGGIRQVDYTTQQWWSRAPGVTKIYFDYSPPDIKKDLADGSFTLVGSQTIDGQNTLELTSSTGGPTDNLWVDAASYLPVLQELDMQAGVASECTTFTWSSVTTDTASVFDLAIPAGYTEVPVPIIAPGSSGASGATGATGATGASAANGPSGVSGASGASGSSPTS